MVYAGLDVGTSGCKGGLVNEKGDVLASAYRGYSFEMPRPGYVELNPETVWQAVRETLKELGSKCRDIGWISVSSIGEALVILDEKDDVLMNGMTYLDSRGDDTLSDIRSRFDEEELFFRTGVPLNPMYSLNKILWLKEHRPSVIDNSSKIFLFEDYIGYMLTGERMIDPSSASRTMLFDAIDLKWSKEVGEKFQIPLDRFSEVRPTGTSMGKIRKSIASELNLSGDVKVVLGCHDQCSAMLGAGAAAAGDIIAGEGSTESINLVVDKENITGDFYEKKVIFEPYVEKGKYLVPVGQLSHGSSIRWFIREIGHQSDELGKSYEEADEGCAPDSGELYFLPYMSKVKSQDAGNKALGVFIGLEMATKYSQMYRALLEGLCFETKKSFERLESLKLPIHKITATGGCTKSKVLMQMKADVLGKDISLLQSADAGISGLAIVCAKADGKYGTYREAAQDFVRTGITYRPDRVYAAKYERYCEISEVIKRLYE